MAWLSVAVVILLVQLAVTFYAVRHYCRERDAEWRMWAQDRGIDTDYPRYGYTRKDGV